METSRLNTYQKESPMSYEQSSGELNRIIVRRVIPEGFKEVTQEMLLAGEVVALPELIFYCYDEEEGVHSGTWEYVSYFMQTLDPRYNASYQSGTVFAIPDGEEEKPKETAEAKPAPRNPLEGMTPEQVVAAQADFLKTMTEWATAKSALDNAKALEDTLRTKLERSWIFQGNKGEFTPGWEVSRKYPETTEMDTDAWVAIKPKLVEEGWNPDPLVRTKVALEKKKYNLLPANIKKIIDTTMTTKVGKVQIEVKKIKE